MWQHLVKNFPSSWKTSHKSPLIGRRLFRIGNYDNAALADEIWVTCLETCAPKASQSHDFWKCVEQGEGGEKQEEQVESREQMLLSSQLDEALEEFDI